MAIIIAGYYGFGNAGDELILLSLIRRFQNESPDESIIVFSKSPEETRNTFGVEACDRWRPWTWIAPLWRAKRFILGGGGLLQESTGPLNHVYYLSLLVMAKIWGCRTEGIALGVDPVQGRTNQFLTRLLLNHFIDELSVRDEDSLQALRQEGVRIPITIEADPVSQLPLKSHPASNDRIAFALVPSKSHPHWSHDVARLCDRIAKYLEISVDFLVFFPYEDERFSLEVANESKNIKNVRVWRKPDDLLSWVPEYRLVVASRFHALVLAKTYEVPFIGWGEQKKVSSFCAMHHRPYTNTEKIWNEDDLFTQIAEGCKPIKKSVILAHEQIDFA